MKPPKSCHSANTQPSDVNARSKTEAERGPRLERALNGLVLTQVQCFDELLDLGLAARVLLLPPRQLSTLVCEGRVLVQRLAVYMPEQANLPKVSEIVELIINLWASRGHDCSAQTGT